MLVHQFPREEEVRPIYFAWGKSHGAANKYSIGAPPQRQNKWALPPLPVETDIQCLYKKIFPHCSKLTLKCFHVESTYINNQSYFTSILLSPAEQGRVYTAEGN